MERTEKQHIPFVIATKNEDKVLEIREILREFPFEIRTMTEAGVEDDIEENGTSFEENALIKALAVHSRIGGFVMADDSGLAIDALGGAPGIYSARFNGTGSSYPEKIQALWKLLADIPLEMRTAHFICAIAVVFPDGSHFTVQESLDGIFYDKIIGENGFGYDPIFIPNGYDVSFAEIDAKEKNKISHRALAVEKLVYYLKSNG